MAKGFKLSKLKGLQPYKPPKIKDPFKEAMKAFKIPDPFKLPKEPKYKEMHIVSFYERQVQEKLCNAIRNRRLIRFYYTDKTKDHADWRTVEPHLIGENIKTGNIILSAWYLPTQQQRMFGETEGWKDYILENIDILTIDIQNETFRGKRPRYNPNDSRMSIIHCRVL